MAVGKREQEWDTAMEEAMNVGVPLGELAKKIHPFNRGRSR